MAKQSCWEFKECGREPGGAKVDELGVCPAAVLESADGYCDGENGGRACAYVAGTFCSGTINGTHAEKEKACGECDFYLQLKDEHPSMTLLSFLRHARRTNGK